MAAVAWSDSEPARTQGRAVTAAVRCAPAGDRPDYEAAIAALSALPAASTGALLGAVVRLLVEESHPGGLDGDDIREVLGRCLADARVWLPGASVSVSVLIAVLSSALGIHEAGVTYVELLPPDAGRAEGEWVDPEPAAPARTPSTSTSTPTSTPTPTGGDQPPPPTPAEYGWHAPLLIASLLAVAGRPVSTYLDTAFQDIARVELMEMP